MSAKVFVALTALLAAACVDPGRPSTSVDRVASFDGGRAANLKPDVASDTRAVDVPAAAVDALPTTADVPVPLLGDGMACTAADGCASGFCVDGVCCSRACDAPCEACDLASGRGTCSPVPAGEDSGNDCPQDPVSSCAKDGTCNGAGQCRLYVSGTQCAPPSCQGATEVSAKTCDGAGACKDGTSRSCAPAVCKNDSCASACTASGDCQAGYYCANGTCTVKGAPASPCTTAEQCSTGFCIDGVCCNSACTETCSACNLANTAGTCSPVPDKEDPANECAEQAASTCGRVGGCNGAGACRMHPNSTTCLAPTCSRSMATAASKCNGSGMCVAQTATSCGGFVCNGTACRTTCTADMHCRSGHGCTAGRCVLLKIAKLTVFDTANAAHWSIRRNFQIGVDGAHPWVDWAPSYVSAIDGDAKRLLGKEWIKLAAASKRYTGGPQAEITLAASADVYLAVDDRWGTPPSFTRGWTDTGWDLRIWETAALDFPFSLYRKSDQTGTVSLPSIGRAHGYDYFVIVD